MVLVFFLRCCIFPRKYPNFDEQMGGLVLRIRCDIAILFTTLYTGDWQLNKLKLMFCLLFGSRWIAWTTRNHLTVNFRLGRTLQQPVFIPVLLSDLIISVSDYSRNYMLVAFMWLVFHLLELCTSIDEFICQI